MFENQQYRFNVSFTREPYPKKPDKSAFKDIRFERQTDITIDDFVGAVEMGYGFTYIYNQRDFHISYKTKENFKYTKFLAFDIDDTDCEFERAIGSCVYPPTIAYRTYSDGYEDKCSYRFVYMFNDYINSQNFYEIYNAVASLNGFGKDLDKREYNQFYFGTDKQDTYVSYEIYNLADFNVEKVSYMTSTPLILSEDESYYTFPDEYYEVKRLWYYDKTTNRHRIRKYTDEGKLSRRKQLYLDGQMIKRINDIDNVEIMYKILQNELKLFYDNSTDTITEEQLRDIAKRIMIYPFVCKTTDEHPSFRINVPYWKTLMNKDNNTYKPIVAINHIRKKIKLDLFKKLYNPNLSYNENMKIMKENNLNIKRATYYNFKKEIKCQGSAPGCDGLGQSPNNPETQEEIKCLNQNINIS